MEIQLAKDEFSQALKLAQKEYRTLTAADKNLHPAVLDEILPDHTACMVQEIGPVEIPVVKEPQV